jgi:hypothetical protein
MSATMQETYQEERNKKRETLHALSAGIAAGLGDDWRSIQPEGGDDWRSTVRKGAKGGPELFISNTWAGKGRIHIGGSFPHGNGGTYAPRGEKFSITVAEGRAPAEVAKEVARRLLPEYLTAFEAATTAKTRDETAREDARSLAYQLAEILGDGNFATRYSKDGYRSNESSFSVYGTGGGVTVEVRAYGSAAFKIDTSNPANALAIAKAVARTVTALR